MILLAAAACRPVEGALDSGTTDPGSDTGTDSDSATSAGYPSAYTYGQYRLVSLSLNAEEDGIDVTGDGVPENNLPNALKLIDLALSQLDLSRENLNLMLADALDTDAIVYLLQAGNADGSVTVDWLPGQINVQGLVEPQPTAFGSDGMPLNRMYGTFSSETAFAAGPGALSLSVYFFPPPAPPALIPVEGARLQGDLTAESAIGVVGGAIPADLFISDVVDPLVPANGIDTNGDGYVDVSKEQIMATITTLADNPNVADVDLGGGRRGVSVAMTYEALPATW